MRKLGKMTEIKPEDEKRDISTRVRRNDDDKRTNAWSKKLIMDN
jgi:hypothetical protein